MILVEGQKLPEILVILVMIPLMDMELVVSTVITLNVYHVMLVTFYFLQLNVNPAIKYTLNAINVLNLITNVLDVLVDELYIKIVVAMIVLF